MKAALPPVVAGMLIAGVTAQSADARLKVHRAGQGAVRAELRYQTKPNSIEWTNGRFRIWIRGRLVVKRRIAYGAVTYRRRPIAVRQLDGTGRPEVLLDEYSGGNGCCWTHWIYAGARRIRAPWLGPPTIRDGDGDGKPEFYGVEPRWFLWGARSRGRSPIKVWTYSARAVHDVTRSFPADVESDQAEHYAAYQSAVAADSGSGARNALASYVADGYTLGQGDASMAVLQAAADAGHLDNTDEVDQASTAEYLDQLADLLREGGYTT